VEVAANEAPKTLLVPLLISFVTSYLQHRECMLMRAYIIFYILAEDRDNRLIALMQRQIFWLLSEVYYHNSIASSSIITDK
jgi:hypothetical protein